MNGVEFAKLGLESSKGWAQGLLADMQDAPLTQPTQNGGNHPLWVIGHLAYSESTLFDEFILGRPNRYAEWKGVFAAQSTPSTDGSLYPPFEKVMSAFDAIRSDSMAHLETLTDADLDESSHAPEEFGAMFGTVGGCYGAMATHTAFHAGQVADARRAAGRPPLMM